MRFFWKESFLPFFFCLVFVMAGCGGNSIGTQTTQKETTGSFSLAVSPSGLTLTPDATPQSVSVVANPSDNFAQPVVVSLAGLPSGVSANPSTLTLTPGTPQSVTMTATTAAAGLSSTITFSGTAGTLSSTATAKVVVAALSTQSSPDFSLSFSPVSTTIIAGSTTSAQVTLTATPLNGFTGSIALSLAGLPASVTLNPQPSTITAGTPEKFTLTAASTAAAGAYTVTVTGTSGSLKHSATLGLTITKPTPDFSLTLTPAAATITAGSTTGTTLSLKTVASDGFSGTVDITLKGLPTGVTAKPASLALTPGTAQQVTLTASASAALGAFTVTFTGTSGALSHSETLALTVQSSAIADVNTYHYDNTRQGINSHETILTQGNVKSTTFGKVGLYAADGHVDATPLFAANVAVSSTDTENLVYIASEHDTVYAYAAGGGPLVWQKSLLEPGESTSGDHNCDQITPEIGITATPVIDRKHGPHGTIFVVGMSVDAGGKSHQRLHALDLATGAELSGSPTEITATYSGKGDNSSNGVVTFDPSQYAERAGLLLLNGTIYLGWTSHCDQRPYTGWIMGYSETTYKQTTVLNLTPNGNEGSVWMAGYGLAADTSGYIYLLAANGSFSGNFNASGFPSDDDYGNAMIKLSTNNGKLAVADYFQAYNTVYESSIDEDLGSGGAMLLPAQADSSGTTRQLLVGAGKDDNIYVANTANMGKFNRTGSNNSNVYQELTSALAQGAWSGPAYFNNTVYYGGQGDVLKAFPFEKARLVTTPSSKSATVYQYPGTTPSVSANGTSNGIVWAVEDSPGYPAVLHAYNAANLADELYNSNQASDSRDAFGNGNKFITPVVANGNVYVGTPNGVAVFGLLAAQ